MKQIVIKTFFVTLLSVLGFCKDITAQDATVHLTNTTNVSYNIQDIQKINYSGTTMNLHLWDASIYSWDVTEIAWFDFNSNTTQMDEILNQINDWRINVYPNPAQSQINISFNLAENDEISLYINDITGSCVYENKIGFLKSGSHTKTFELANLKDGMYFLNIKGKTRTCSKQILIKN